MDYVTSLTPEGCDLTASRIMELCEKNKVDRRSAIVYRLAAENCMMAWISTGLEGRDIALRTRKRGLSTCLCLEVSGPASNPFSMQEEDDYGSYFNTLLVGMNLRPEYEYKKGVNRLLFRMKKRTPSQLQVLCTVIVLSTLLSVCGLFLLPASVRGLLLSSLISPLYNLFFTLLGCIAGPMIFFSVLIGIMGIGDLTMLGMTGRKLMIGFIVHTFFAAACSLLLFPLFGGRLTNTGGGGVGLSDVLELILNMFPSNVIEPFSTGNTLQIIFLSIVIGIAILFMGNQVDSISKAIGQMDLLVRFLMESLSCLIPGVIFLLIPNLVWSDAFSSLRNLWRLLLVLAAAILVFGFAELLYISRKYKASLPVLLKKALPSFALAFSTASSGAAFKTNLSTCTDEFGIDSSLTHFGIPLGTIMDKPIVAILFMGFAMYFAGSYQIACTPGWLVIAVLISSIVAIAAPPIAGGGAVAISVLFAQMGIPKEALAVALAVNLLADFPVTAFCVFSLQMCLIDLADNLGKLDKDTLRRPKS